MKKIFLLLFIFPVCAYPQFFQIGFQSEIPPSPISSVFRQFAGYTPSLSTGTVDVPISLYDLKVGDYTLPFTLKYYTSGIKVMDVASPLGYGWTLHPGLRITRTVRGRPDGLYPLPMQIKSQSIVDNMTEEDRFYYLRSTLKSTMNQDNPDYLINNDSQYDIFTIHLPSGDFSFIIKDGVAISYGNMLKITILSDGYCICGFEVIDNMGRYIILGKKTGMVI